MSPSANPVPPAARVNADSGVRHQMGLAVVGPPSRPTCSWSDPPCSSLRVCFPAGLTTAAEEEGGISAAALRKQPQREQCNFFVRCSPLCVSGCATLRPRDFSPFFSSFFEGVFGLFTARRGSSPVLMRVVSPIDASTSAPRTDHHPLVVVGLRWQNSPCSVINAFRLRTAPGRPLR